MKRGRRRPGEKQPGGGVDDRAWSTRTNIHARDIGKDVIRYLPLPAETGPTWAPDRLSIWPVEGGRYGVDAQYHGETGAQRAEHQRVRLGERGLLATVRAGAGWGDDPAPGTARPPGGMVGAQGVSRAAAGSASRRLSPG